MGEYWFDSRFPDDGHRRSWRPTQTPTFEIVTGKTVAGNEFFLEQFRLDGAVCMETAQTKMAWLEGSMTTVRNIEMEGAMLAGYLNHWGFPKFAMICATLLNRLNGDQVTATAEQMHQFSEDSGAALFNCTFGQPCCRAHRPRTPVAASAPPQQTV